MFVRHFLSNVILETICIVYLTQDAILYWELCTAEHDTAFKSPRQSKVSSSIKQVIFNLFYVLFLASEPFLVLCC